MKTKSLKKNILFGVINTVLNNIFPLIVYMYTARILLPSGVGLVQLASSVSSYFDLFASLGIPLYAVREISRLREDKNNQDRNAVEIFWTNIINAFLMLSIYIIFISVVYRFNQSFYIFLVYGISIFSTALGVEWYFKAEENFGYITIRNAIVKVISFLLVIMFINDASDTLIYVLINIGAVLGYSFINFIKFAKSVKLKFIKFNYLKHLKPAFSIFLMSLATTIYCSLDTVMLGYIKNEYSVGIYTAAYRVTTSIIAIITAVNSILLPRLSYYYKTNQFNEIKKILTTSYQITLMIAIPAVIGIELFADNIIMILSGKEFLQAATALRIMAPIILFVAMTNIIGIQVFYSSGHDKKTILSVFCGAITNLIFNSILIPFLSYDGAAIGTFLAELMVLVVQLIIGKNLILFKKLDKNISKILLSSGIMTTILIIVSKLVRINYLIDFVIFVIIAVISYIICLLIFKENFILNIMQKVFKKRGKTMMKYDYLIVGAGLFGSVVANELKKKGNKILVIDKRNHIGGDCYTENIEGINVHKYGAHIFRTSNKKIWDYVNSFAEFNRFTNSPIANYKGELYNLPFNMNTFYAIYGTKTPQEAINKIKEVTTPYIKDNYNNLEEKILSFVGPDIYKKLMKGYTEKQWGKTTKELPPSIISRLPLRYTFDNNYYRDKYQGIPIGGYTQIFEKMLDGVDVKLETDFYNNREHFEQIADKIIFTGRIDEFYNCQYGELGFRSLKFENEILDLKDFQGNAVVNYTDYETPYTRIIEHKHFEFLDTEKTVITKEYPAEYKKGMIEHYPLSDKVNLELYAKYRELAKKDEDKIIFCGRLGGYHYWEMQEVIESALNLVDKL